MIVLWNDEKHSIGIADIDSQHKELFLITNQIFAEQDKPDRRQTIGALLKRLNAYARYHFSTEENMLRHHGYQAFGDHKKLHQDFAVRIQAWQRDIRESPQFSTADLLDYLVEWIVFHIQEEDTKYAWDFQKRGISVDIQCRTRKLDGNELDLFLSKKLGLDIHDIDQQHRELVGILQQANDLAKGSPQRQRAFMPDMIRRLFYYGQFHFAFEEELMSRHGWRGLSGHQALHAEFFRKLVDLTRDLKEKKVLFSTDIVEFLKDWTVHHILQEDRSFKDFLSQHH